MGVAIGVDETCLMINVLSRNKTATAPSPQMVSKAEVLAMSGDFRSATKQRQCFFKKVHGRVGNGDNLAANPM